MFFKRVLKNCISFPHAAFFFQKKKKEREKLHVRSVVISEWGVKNSKRVKEGLDGVN